MHIAGLAPWIPAQLAGMVLAALLAVAVLAALFLIIRSVLTPALIPQPVGSVLRRRYMRGEIPRHEYLRLIAATSSRASSMHEYGYSSAPRR